MFTKTKLVSLLALLLLLSMPAGSAEKKSLKPGHAKVESTGPPLIWREPADIATRDLYFGPGGREHQPRAPLTFLKEDPDGSNPKFDVRDADGVRWKVKLGAEARPEVAATRLIWGAGYFANEDYFVATLRVANMPRRLHRGQKWVAGDGSVPNVRLKREDIKKLGTWKWRDDPFTDTRELNGLRVLMALINNWDLKDENNAIYPQAPEAIPDQNSASRHRERVYFVSDLGASFGTAGPDWPHEKSKGNLDSYSRSRFFRKVTDEAVDFRVPARPSYQYLVNPAEYVRRRHLCWIGKDIPREDARWIGGVLANLSPQQIRDAFRSAGYTPQEVEGFAQVVEARIAQLTDL